MPIANEVECCVNLQGGSRSQRGDPVRLIASPPLRYHTQLIAIVLPRRSQIPPTLFGPLDSARSRPLIYRPDLLERLPKSSPPSSTLSARRPPKIDYHRLGLVISSRNYLKRRRPSKLFLRHRSCLLGGTRNPAVHQLELW